MAKNNTPLERVEQARFVDWLEAQGLLFSATAQSTYTTSFNQKRLNHATGLRKGVPDMLVVVSPEASRDGLGYVLFLELKRLLGGVVSPEQNKWVEAINSAGSLQVQAYIAKGADEAITIVSHYLKTTKNSVF